VRQSEGREERSVDCILNSTIINNLLLVASLLAASLNEIKMGVEEANYRLDDACGDALLSDDEGAANDDEEETNYHQWRNKTPIEQALLEGDHPSGDISEGDSEGEMLLATHGDFAMSDQIKSQNWFINVLYPKVPAKEKESKKKAEPKKAAPTSKSKKPSSASSEFCGLGSSSSYVGNDDTPMKRRDFNRSKESKEQEAERSARSFVNILGGWDGAKSVDSAMKTYVQSNVHGAGLVGAALVFRGFAGTLNVRGKGKDGGDEDEGFWREILEGILEGGKEGREEKLKEYLKALKMELELLKKREGGGEGAKRARGEGEEGVASEPSTKEEENREEKKQKTQQDKI